MFRAPWRSRRSRLLTLLAALMAVVTVLAGCSSGSLAGTTTVTSTANAIPDGSGTGAPASDGAASPAAPSSSVPPSPVVVPPVASISARPALNSKGLSPSQPIAVTVDKGTFDDVTLKNPEGTLVDASVSEDGTTFTVDEVLGFGKTYSLGGTATGTDGKKVPVKGTFTTVGTDTQVRNTINPVDGAVVGVAAPISVTFGVEPQDKALIQKNVSVTTTPKVVGSWGWVQHDDGRWSLDYRTKDYWPADTKVHVEAKIYGLKLADNAYVGSDLTTDFTIGRNQVVIADVNSHELVVERDGKAVAKYPASYGRGEDTGDPNLITRSGTHVVNEFFETKLMNNPRYGYSNQPEKWAVRISNNGEFIHANPASTAAQGSSNVTHGCVNLSLADAEAYYKSAIWGDPVEVSGTSVKLGPEDGEIYIWAMSYDEWQGLSAL
ncbi:Ig-like domain-containing protein [Nakamurella sp. GG22]